MKKIIYAAFFSSALLCFSLAGKAQYEVNGGFTTSKQTSNYPAYDSKYKPPDWFAELWKWAKWISSLMPGYHSSADENPYAPSSFAQKLSINYGIGLGSKGGKFPYPGGSAKTSVFYLSIPVLVRYDTDLNDQLGLYAALGPYYAIALGGKYKDEMGKIKLNFGNDDDDDLRRGDFGLKFRLGCRMKNRPITFGLHGEFGLRNLAPDGDDDFRIKNQTFGVQVGYVFNSFKSK